MSVSTFAAAQILRFVPRVKVSRAVGRLCGLSLPASLGRWVTGAYVSLYDVNLNEAQCPPEGYRSFDDFFTRRLKADARPIAASALVSPADGQVVAAGSIAEATTLLVKGQPYSVPELTGVMADRARYAEGHFAVIYLSPRDYHRVHAPTQGRLTQVQAIDGDLYPVNAIGERHVPGLFVRNLRVAIGIDTESHGRATVVMVGATIVGRITVTGQASPFPANDRPLASAMPVQAGDEIGVFHLGSTVVLLTERQLPMQVAVGPIRYGDDITGRP